MTNTSLTSKLADLTPERLKKITERGKELGWKPERDIFSLIMRTTGCSFPEAVRLLADHHGIVDPPQLSEWSRQQRTHGQAK